VHFSGGTAPRRRGNGFSEADGRPGILRKSL
jgi:hypothetical protein